MARVATKLEGYRLRARSMPGRRVDARPPADRVATPPPPRWIAMARLTVRVLGGASGGRRSDGDGPCAITSRMLRPARPRRARCATRHRWSARPRRTTGRRSRASRSSEFGSAARGGCAPCGGRRSSWRGAWRGDPSPSGKPARRLPPKGSRRPWRARHSAGRRKMIPRRYARRSVPKQRWTGILPRITRACSAARTR